MAKQPTKSPAVQAYEDDKARQRERDADGDLDTGIEDSFPASDPISMTRTSVPAGRIDSNEAERVKIDPDPTAPPSNVGENVRTVLGDIRTIIADRPLTALGIVAAAGYLWGLTR